MTSTNTQNTPRRNIPASQHVENFPAYITANRCFDRKLYSVQPLQQTIITNSVFNSSHCEPFSFQCKDACAVCTYCGGFQRLLCPVCHGSKRSVHRNEFTVEFVALKCAKCDVFGMIRCPHC